MSALGTYRNSAAYHLRRAGEERRHAAEFAARADRSTIALRARARCLDTARWHLLNARVSRRMACPVTVAADWM